MQVNNDFQRLPTSDPLVVLPVGINLNLDVNLAPTPEPTPEGGPGDTRYVVSETSTAYREPTLGPQWRNGPTPRVASCRELCTQRCAPAQFVQCQCANLYAVPTLWSCQINAAPASLSLAPSALAAALVALAVAAVAAQ